MNRRGRSLLAVGVGVALSAGLLGAGPGLPTVVARAAGARTAHHGTDLAGGGDQLAPGVPIRHVVIIYQENHTFDDVLGAVCQTRANPCNGYTGPVTFANGTTAPNIVQPDVVPESEHSPKAQRFAMRDQWNRVGGCASPPYSCISHVDPANIPNLARLADTFTVSDATFAAGQAASFGAHVTLGGGTFDGFAGNNPVRSKTGVSPGEGWGCGSNRDALWGPAGHRSFQPTCIPTRSGQGPYRPTAVKPAATIMQRMEQAGLSWHIYEGPDNTTPLIGPWSVCTYFAWCWLHRFDSRHDSQRPDFVRDAKAGTLPNLSILLPTGSSPLLPGVSQHNGNSMKAGDTYIGQMVGAAMNGPEWDSTAIFITYDDCGCFYDHVTPPSKHMGLRNPMVIISPWAKPQGTDSQPAVQPYSMLAFTEHVFGLDKLTAKVSRAYDYANSFNFDQHPLQGPPMVRQQVSAAEQRRLARLEPSVVTDPT